MNIKQMLVALVLGAAAAAPWVAAESPPGLPLPACTEENGVQQGACPLSNQYLTGSAGGSFSPGGTLTVVTAPTIPVCNEHSGYPPYAWNPGPCYSAVRQPAMSTCGYIDLADNNTFKETSCSSALYQNSSDAPYPLFTLEGPDGGYCEAAGNYGTYIYGGPANVPGATWPEFGPSYLDCKVTFNGTRPDGLYGPTWVKVQVTIDKSEDGDQRTGYPERAEFFVAIDGDLRFENPIAAFTSETLGRKATFSNESVHPQNKTLTYSWDFGDGKTATSANPEHVYEEGGTYTVSLMIKDPDGLEDSATGQVEVEEALVVIANEPESNVAKNQETTFSVEVHNYTSDDVGNMSLALNLDTTLVEVIDGPKPTPVSALAKDDSIVTYYTVKPIKAGIADAFVYAEGALPTGEVVSGDDTLTLDIPPELAVELNASVVSTTVVGEEVTFTLTITNLEDFAINNIRVEPLGVLPNDNFSTVSGPTAADGSDPRVSPFSLAGGASATVTWVYRAEAKGVTNLSAFVAADNPFGGRFSAGDELDVAVESASMIIKNLRLQPGRPVPGATDFLRGTLVNNGSVDITDIDFQVDGNPPVEAVMELIAKMDPGVSPLIPLLIVDQEREFIVPITMPIDVGGKGDYNIALEFLGQATIDGTDVAVTTTEDTANGLDLSQYWTSILGEVKSYLLNGFISAIDDVNDWADKSTLGGVAVGGGEGVLNALQKMGDGVLSANDFIGETVGNGGQQLTEEGTAIVGAIREYAATTSKKQMAKDLVGAGYDVTIAGVDVFAQWMGKVDKAYTSGDTQEVTRLLAEPTTELALSIGGEMAVEKAASGLFEKLISNGTARKFLRGKKEAAALEAGENATEAQLIKYYDEIGEEIKDIPTGVPLRGETVARLGVADDEYAWFINSAKEQNVTFFIRPRPEEAAKYAKLGYNAKPMAIKLKSITDIDIEWLGFDDFADRKGLVVLREPKDPYPALRQAIRDGRFEGTEPEFYDVIERYHKKQAEWESRQALLDKLNAGDGFNIRRYGKDVKTKVSINDDGLMIMSHNGQPIYSDIDVYQIGNADGSAIPASLHEQISREGDFAFDRQHGDTASAADFPNQETAQKFIVEYGEEHMRGGEPLIIVQGDATTLGYVKSVTLNPAELAGSDYNLYGQVATVKYEGAGIR